MISVPVFDMQGQKLQPVEVAVSIRTKLWKIAPS